MNTYKALQTVYIISIAGLMFSGYLTYKELFGDGCTDSFITCNNSFSLFNMPACFYGFFMYLIILLISLWGLKKEGDE